MLEHPYNFPLGYEVVKGVKAGNQQGIGKALNGHTPYGHQR